VRLLHYWILLLQGLAALDAGQKQGDPSAAVPAQDSSTSSSSGSGSSARQRLTLLGDAVAYLSDIVSGGAAGDEVLLEAGKVALRQAQEQQELAKLQR
jgi:hypothetical protein